MKSNSIVKIMVAALLAFGAAEANAQSNALSTKVLYETGMRESLRGNLSAAATAFEQVVLLESNNAQAYVQLGLIAHQAGRQQEANGYFLEAIKIKPELAGHPLLRSKLNAATTSKATPSVEAGVLAMNESSQNQAAFITFSGRPISGPTQPGLSTNQNSQSATANLNGINAISEASHNLTAQPDKTSDKATAKQAPPQKSKWMSVARIAGTFVGSVAAPVINQRISGNYGGGMWGATGGGSWYDPAQSYPQTGAVNGAVTPGWGTPNSYPVVNNGANPPRQ